MPRTNIPSAWRKRPKPVNRNSAARPLVLMCANDGDGMNRPYAQVLEEQGFEVMDLSLFSEEILTIAPPHRAADGLSWLAIPSARAAQALFAQDWFEKEKHTFRALVPGPETRAAVESQGITVVWTAANGFRRSPLPAELATRSLSYIGNAALKPEDLSLPFKEEDRFLPAYRRAARSKAPWTPLMARRIVQAERLIVLALSPTQRKAFEAPLRLLGSKRPKDLHLVAMTDRRLTRFSAQFWDQMTVPAYSSRNSLIKTLKSLAF